MTWLVQAGLINEPFSDPGLFIDFRFGRRAPSFDLGDLTPLSPAAPACHPCVRIAYPYGSFCRVRSAASLHRTTPLQLIGPAGFADRVEHKLRAYTLNLLDAQSVDVVIIAAESSGDGFDRSLRIPRP